LVRVSAHTGEQVFLAGGLIVHLEWRVAGGNDGKKDTAASLGAPTTGQQMIGWIGSFVLVGGGLLLLRAILRFSIISPRRTRGWKNRLHQPNLPEVESTWKVQLPRSLESLFQSNIVELSEVYLSPAGIGGSARWYVARFIPFTSRDLAEWIKITSVPGFPLAIDGDEGVYYLSFDDLRDSQPPAVLFRAPGMKQATEVARTIEDFMQFQPVLPTDLEAN
jgi:hypothetical protein